MSPGSFCNRAPVDALLQYYSAATQRQEIRADLALTIPAGVPLGDVEWCTVLGNLLENAVEACRREPMERRLIRLRVARRGGAALLVLADNPCLAPVSFEDGLPLSSKRAGHGIGAASVREIAVRYGGEARFEQRDGMFRASVFLSLAREKEAAV